MATNSLSGTISPALGSLTSLRSFGLYGNYLSGTIPRILGALTFLGLGTNSLSGTISPALGSLTSLRHFDMEFNLYQLAVWHHPACTLQLESPRGC